GLTARYLASRCLPCIRSTSMTSSGTSPLRLSAIRTRNVASERQNENSFTDPPLRKNCERTVPTIIYRSNGKTLHRADVRERSSVADGNDFGRGDTYPRDGGQDR